MQTRTFQRLGIGAALVALAGVTVLAQIGADRARPQRKDELVYLPNEKLLTNFTAGMSSVIADMLWLRCVQYMGAQFTTEHNYTWLNQLLNTVVRMDPNFKDVYRFGSIFLSAVKADDSAGLDLLQRGIVQRPDAWELPYEAAMVFLINRRDQPESRKLAAYYLSMSVATGRANRAVIETAAALQGENNLDAIEGDMWAGLQKSGDKVLQELAARKQQELAIRQNLHVLDDNVARFTKEKGRAPQSLDEVLDAGYFGEKAKGDHGMLKDPLGGHYLIDPAGKAQSTTLLDVVRDKYLNNIRDAIKQYHEEKGSYPVDLQVLTEKFLPEVYAHPYAGQTWKYDALTGEVSG